MTPDVAASVSARLLAQAKTRGEEFELTLTRFAAERLLFRLGESGARDRCILKGGRMLSVWLPDPYRATRDIDVLATGATDDAAIEATLREICAIECPEDGFRFDLSGLTVDAIRADEEYAGKRARFNAYLGRARIRVQVDFGYGDAQPTAPEEIEYPTMLDALPAPRLRGYRRETTVAEKFQAMVKLDTQNSRMKDFHDVWTLAGEFPFEGPVLREAVAACFERRSTPWTAETPRPLTAAFYDDPSLGARWTGYIAAGAVLVPPPAQFGLIGQRVIGFLGPLRESILEEAPFALTWPPSGPWRSTTEPSA